MGKNELQFNYFKIHTQYSICEGAIKIDDLSQYCKENKIKAIGICDSFNLCGALEFSEKLSKVGTQPIIGTQINFKYNNEYIAKLPVFAISEKGFVNLSKLSTKSFLDIDHQSKPHCLLDDLFIYGDDLIVLSGGINDFFGGLYNLNKSKQIEDILKKFRNTFKDRFYIEIQRHLEPNEKNFEEYLINQSKKYDIPLIASQETFYINKDMFEAHDALICIGEKSFVNDEKRLRYSPEHYLKSYDSIKNLYSDIPEALENNLNFPFRFHFKLNKSKPNLPKINVEGKETVENLLLSEAQKGLEKRLNNHVLKKKARIVKRK